MLIREIWLCNRKAIGWAIGLALCGLLFDSAFAGANETTAGRDRRLTIEVLLMIGSLLLVFAVFNYTEFNPRKGWAGFPYRLFTLPLPTFALVALPIVLGLAAIELIFWCWVKVIFAPDDLTNPLWIAILLGSFMVIYEFILWAMAGFKILRLLTLGLLGAGFVGVGFLPALAVLDATGSSFDWCSERNLRPLLVLVATGAFLAAWVCVARQRSGGGFRRNGFMLVMDALGDFLPRRRTLFQSPSHAQFWLEWRRNGYLLPLSVGALLFTVIAPLSWAMRGQAGMSLWIFVWTLATPMILALPIGKGFSRPDFWSSDLGIPSFTAIRPLSSGEWVVVKLKVAALSTVLSWLLLLSFLAIWLPNWANLSSLTMIRVAFWMAHGHSVYPQYVIAALLVLTGVFVTWKFLVGGLWIGLSGSRKLFVGSAATFGFVWLGGAIGLAFLANHDRALLAWIHRDPNRLIETIEGLAAAAVVAKLWCAARFWRFIQARRTRLFLCAWLAGTLGIILLVRLLWAGGTLTLALMALFDLLPLDPVRLRNVLLLAGLLLMPFARLGLAPLSLAHNRHGSVN